MYDVTPVENLFILEYLPYAPGDYVRVYLYGLMQCYHPAEDSSLEGIARVLDMKSQQVLDAFRYWEQKGVVVGLSDNPPTFEFVNLRQAMLEGHTQEAEAYSYKTFNNELQAAFGSDRLLHPQEFSKAMEWVEDLKLPKEVVLKMVRHKIDVTRKRGRSVRAIFKELEKTALDFAERDVRTIEAAEQALLRETMEYDAAKKVLTAYSLRRAPTVPEIEITRKWIEEWGFTEADILRAQKETVRGSNPSFAYLDGILKNLRGVKEVDKAMEDNQAQFEAVKAILKDIGLIGSVPTKAELDDYRGFLDAGMDPEVLRLAARHCGMTNRRSFDAFRRIVLRWKEVGITTPAAVEDFAKRREDAFLVFEKCGINRRPGEADIEQLSAYKKRFPMEVVLFAAECSRGMQLPLRYMHKLLSEWEAKGITSLSDAQRERGGHQSRPQKDQPMPAQQYTQRTYQEGELDYLFEDIDAYIEEKKNG